MNCENLYAARMSRVKLSEIAEMAKDSQGCLSLAEGVPAADMFPIEEMIACSKQILEERGKNLLQYGNYGGVLGLRTRIAHIVKLRYEMNVSEDNILVTTGSTQCMDLLGRVFIDEGDIVLVETPSYIDGMNTFAFYGGHIQNIPSDDDGMDLVALEQYLSSHDKVKAIYVIPDFQNPTGRYWSVEKRKAFMNLVNQYDLMVLEDNPYGEINYSDENRPSLASMDTKRQVVYMGSFSKTFSPGLRVGYVIGHKTIVDQLELTKESVDLHSTALNHAIIEQYMVNYSYDDHVSYMCNVYKKRLDTLCDTLARELPEFRFIKPLGGFFLWVTIPDNIHCYDLFHACIKEKVSFVPGLPFYSTKDNTNHIRLNFTGISEDNIVEAVTRMKRAYESLL